MKLFNALYKRFSPKSIKKEKVKSEIEIMADTAIESEEEKKEYFDEPDVLDQKVSLLAQMVLSSNHFVAFTGAGISTSSGIPDYRSGYNTVLETGPGCWETAANK